MWTEFTTNLMRLFDQWGLGIWGVVIFATTTTITLIFCLREVISWLTKTQSLRSELVRLRDEIRHLQREVRYLNSVTNPPAKEAAPTPPPTQFKIKTPPPSQPQPDQAL